MIIICLKKRRFPLSSSKIRDIGMGITNREDKRALLYTGVDMSHELSARRTSTLLQPHDQKRKRSFRPNHDSKSRCRTIGTNQKYLIGAGPHACSPNRLLPLVDGIPPAHPLNPVCVTPCIHPLHSPIWPHYGQTRINKQNFWYPSFLVIPHAA